MSTIKANTLLHSDGSTTNPPAIPALDKRMAHSFITFKGTDTVAIEQSYNVTSLVDVGTGIYRVNFSANPSTTLYTGLVSSDQNINNTPWYEKNGQLIGSYEIRTHTGSSYVDTRRLFSLIFST